MSEPAVPEKPDFIEKIADYAGWILAVSVAVIIAAWSLYFFQFRGVLSDDTAIWGQFGDFVGGTLNSVFAFFSFMILLSSLRLQLKELRLTREELEATRKELAASSAAQKMQAEHFDREARKSDHTDAIKIYNGNKIFRDDGGIYVLEIDNTKQDKTFFRRDLGGNNLPRLDDIESNKTLFGNAFDYNSVERLKDRAEHLVFLDYHCHKLWKIFPKSPTLITSISIYEQQALRLEELGWIDELEFFGKHDLPFA